ncbi:MAG: ComEC/Rec2 family competence protein, partial [Parvibaculales bacterium]
MGSSTAIIVACGVLSWLLRSSIWRLVPICIGIIAFGISISALRMEEIAAPILDENYSSKEVLGVVEWVTPTRNSFRIDLRILSIEGFKKEEVPKRIQLYWNTEEAHSLIPGCQIYAKMRLFALEENKVQGGYDARFWRQFSGIGGRGSMKELLYADCSKKLSWKEKINHIRIHLTDKLSGKTRASNILPALVTGVRYKIDPQAHQALRDSGLAHILAISGLHMAFFAIMIFQGLVTFLSVSSYHIQKFPLRAICSVIAIG